MWRILLSESVWCPWQPASQQPPPQQDAISAFPVFFFFFTTLPSFCLWRLYQVFSGVILRPPLSYLVFLVAMTLCLSLYWHQVCLCLDIVFVSTLHLSLSHCPGQGNLCCPSTSVRWSRVAVELLAAWQPVTAFVSARWWYVLVDDDDYTTCCLAPGNSFYQSKVMIMMNCFCG